MPKHKKQITFLCSQDQIVDLNENGQFKLDQLKIFSLNTDTAVVIKGYGLIEKGELNLIC